MQRKLSQLKQFREEDTVSQISDTRNEEIGRADEIAAKKVGLSRDSLWTAQGRIPLFLVRTTGAQKQINPHLTYPLIFSLAAPEAVVFNKGQQ